MLNATILRNGNNRPNIKYVNVRILIMNVILDLVEWEIIFVSLKTRVITTLQGKKRMRDV